MSGLQVRNLTKHFHTGFWPFTSTHTHTVVDTLSFDLHKGEILGFLGPNGAGKTTTISMLLGILTPTHGSIHYFGMDFFKHRVPILTKIGYANGYDRLPPRLTILENLDVISRMYGMTKSLRLHQIESLLRFFGIWNIRHRQTGSLSAGQATRVMLAKAFIADPEIVLLDEPTASLDPDVAHEVREFILTQRKAYKTSVLITSHNMDEVTTLCDRVLIMKQGSIIADNTPQQLAGSASKVRVHLTVTEPVATLTAYVYAQHMTYTVKDQVVLPLT
jgi:ABC-2 type transport system ATP-binding protein